MGSVSVLPGDPAAMFLTTPELRELTGYAHRAKQAEWLKANQWPFEISATGRVLVLRDYMLSRMSGFCRWEIMTELEAYEWWKTEQDVAGYKQSEIVRDAWRAGCKWQRERGNLVIDAAVNLCNVKGRFHAEQAMKRLIQSINHYQSVSN